MISFKNKSIKTITKIIHNYMIVEIEQFSIIQKYDHWMYDDNKKIQNKKESARRRLEKACNNMLQAFETLNNDQLWDQIVGQVVTDKEGKKHQLIDCWSSQIMRD